MRESTKTGPGSASRRTFLAGAGLVGAAAGAGALASRAEADPAVRSYRNGAFALELEGKTARALAHASGGHPVGVVVPDDPSGTTHKHIAGVKYEDISVTCGTGMSKEFYEWIGQCLAGKEPTHSGVLTSREADGTVFDVVSFTDALISEVGFPALDAASKDTAEMTVKFRPESTVRGKPESSPTDVKQKLWHAANFRLEIDGVDCTRVTTIDGLTVTQAFAVSKPGDPLQPTTLAISDLVLTTKPSHSQDFYDWLESLVIEGKDDKRTGSLIYFADDARTALFTLTFSGLGIWAVDAIPPSAARQRAARIGCHVWCEGLTFKAHPPAVG